MATLTKVNRVGPGPVPTSSSRIKTAGFDKPSSSSLVNMSIEELNRRNAPKCINCCAFINKGNKNDMAKVVFSVNLAKTQPGLDPISLINNNMANANGSTTERKILMSAIQAMDVMFQVNEHPELKKTVRSGSMCHNCTKTFGAFFQLYLQFISCSQPQSPVRAMVEKVASIRRNLRILLTEENSASSVSQTQTEVPKPKAPLKPPVPMLVPQTQPMPNANVDTRMKKPLANIHIRRMDQEGIKEHQSTSVSKPNALLLKQTVSPNLSKPTNRVTPKFVSLPITVSRPATGPAPVTYPPRPRMVRQIQSNYTGPVEPKFTFVQPPIPPPRIPAPLVPVSLPEPDEQPERDPLSDDVTDEDLQSLLLSRGRKQQFTKVREVEEPVFEDPDAISETDALNAVSALKAPPKSARSRSADIQEGFNKDDPDFKPSSSKIRKMASMKKPNDQSQEADEPVLLKCEKCCEQFKEHDQLEAHSEFHENVLISKWKCLLCVCGFKDFQKKCMHMLRAHSRDTRSSKRSKVQYGCGMCASKFDIENEFKAHLMSEHFSCPNCIEVDAMFSSQEEINGHMDTHGAGNWVDPIRDPTRIKTRSERAAAAVATAKPPRASEPEPQPPQLQAESLQLEPADPVESESGIKIKLDIFDDNDNDESDTEPPMLSLPNELKAKRIRPPVQKPCPICGKAVTRVDRHIAEVHEKQPRDRRPKSQKRKI